MTPTAVFLAACAAAIGADTNGLAEAAFVGVSLVKAPFVPSQNLVIGDLTLADFTDSDTIFVTSAAAQVFLDPATAEWILQLDEPLGGWHWVTGDAVLLPQTIYGYALTNHAKAKLLGTALFDVPVLLNAAAQGVDIAQVRFRLSNAALT